MQIRRPNWAGLFIATLWARIKMKENHVDLGEKFWSSLLNNLSKYLFRAINCHSSETEKSEQSKNDESVHFFNKFQNFWYRSEIMQPGINEPSLHHLVRFGPTFINTYGTARTVRTLPPISLRPRPLTSPRSWNPVVNWCDNAHSILTVLKNSTLIRFWYEYVKRKWVLVVL